VSLSSILIICNSLSLCILATYFVVYPPLCEPMTEKWLSWRLAWEGARTVSKVPLFATRFLGHFASSAREVNQGHAVGIEQ
jgi:hypothetical protein